MKHFYISNFAVRVQSATEALGKATGSKTRNFLTLTLLSVFMLLGTESFGATFTISSNQASSGNWNASGWTITNATSTTGNFPGPEDDVVIEGKYSIIVPLADNPTWKSLTLRFNTGSSTPGITINGGLTVSNLSIDASNNATNSKASLIINGNLVINGTGTWATNGKYDFICGTASTVTYNGTTSIIIPQSTPTSNNNNSVITTYGPYNNLILSGTGTKTASANLTINKDLTISSGTATFDAGTFTHSVNGNITNNGILDAKTSTIRLAGNYSGTGAFNKGTGTMVYNGPAQNIAALEYHNLTFEGSGNKTASGTIKVSGNLTHTAGSFVHGGQKLIYNGAAQNVAGLYYHSLEFAGTSTKTALGDIFVSGDLTAIDQAVFVPATKKVTLNGGAQQIAGLQFYDLTLAGSGAKTAYGNISVSNVFAIESGVTFAPNGKGFSYNGADQAIVAIDYYGLDLTGTGNKTASGDITVAGNLTASAGINFVANGKQVVINGADQDVAGLQYFKLSFAGTGTKRALGNIRVADSFITGAITFNHNNQLFTYNGVAQAVMPLTYYDLMLTTSADKAAGNAPFMMGDINIVNTIKVENARLVTGDKVVKLGSAANITSEENANQHIRGIVEASRTVGSGATETFGNIGFRILGSGANLGNVKVKRVTGQAFESPINDNYSVNRQFYVSSESGIALDGLNASIDMNFPDHDLTAPLGTTSYDIYRYANNVLDMLGNVPTTDPTYKYKLENAQKFGMYTISSNVTPLPVELVWFKAERQAKGVNLTWLTASEKDNSGFEVQVSTDGKNFSKIGFVKSAVTTSSVAQRYSFMDKNMAAGTRYYRLAQIDLDGTTTYSNVKAVDVDGLKVAVAAYPNPFADNVTVQLPTGAQREVRAVLANPFGQLLSEQRIETSETGELAVDMSSAMTSGVYILQVIDNGSKHTFKLMKK